MAPGTPASNSKKHGGADISPVDPNDSKKVFRYEHCIQDVEVTEAFALHVNDSPMLTIFVSDQSTTKATRVAPVSSDHHAPPLAGRNYICYFELDISSLLAGELVIAQQWGENPLDSLSDGIMNLLENTKDTHQYAFHQKKISHAEVPHNGIF